MKLRYLVFFLSSLSVTPVSATNFYVGLNAGLMDQSGDMSIIDTRLNPSVGITEVKDYQFPDDSSLTWSPFVGYKLGRDLALEVGYAKNAEIEGVRRLLDSGEAGLEKAETDYIYVAFVGVWPIASNWAFNARLGFSVWDLAYTQTVTDPLVANPTAVDVIRTEYLSDTSSATLVGFGASYGFAENFELKLSVEQHFVDFSFTNVNLDFDAFAVTVGTAYHF